MPKRPTVEDLNALEREIAQKRWASPPVEKPENPVENQRISSGKPVEKEQGGQAHLPTEAVGKPTEMVGNPTEAVGKPTQKVGKPTEVGKPTASPPPGGQAHQESGQSHPHGGQPHHGGLAKISKYQRYEQRRKQTGKSVTSIRLDDGLKQRSIERATALGLDFAAYVAQCLEGGLAHPEWAVPPPGGLALRLEEKTRLDQNRTRAEYVAATGRPWRPADRVGYARIASLPEPVREAGLYKALLLGAKDMRSFGYIVTITKEIQREYEAGLHSDIVTFAEELKASWEEKNNPPGG